MNSKGKINLLLITLFLTVLLSFSAFGVTFVGEPHGQWQSIGFDRFQSNSYVYFTGSYSGQIADGTNFSYTDTESAGGNFQPLAFDWDSDGVVEIIAPQGTNLKVYDPSTNALVEEASYSLGASLGSQGFCGTDDTLGKYCAFIAGSNFVNLAYDGTTVSTLASTPISADIDSVDSGLSCFSSTEYTIPYCFAVGRNSSSTDDLHLLQIRADTDNDIAYLSGSYEVIGVDATDFANQYKPTITDYDYDNVLDIIFPASDNDASLDTFMLHYNWSNSTNDVTFVTGTKYTSDIDILSFGGYFVHDLNGAGDEERCAFSEHTNADLNLECQGYDTVKVSTDNNDIATGLVLTDIDGDITPEIVAIYVDDTDSTLNLATYEADSGSFVAIQTNVDLGIPSTYTEYVPTAAKINGDSYFDLIIGDYIVYFNSSGEVDSIDQKNIVQKYSIPVNFNQDGYIDIVAQQFNNLGLYSTATGGTPTSSTITLNTVIDDSGFYNYYSTVCKDTTTTFKALECVSGSFDSTCTYINTDSSASERIYTTCGGLDNVNGTYSGLNPSVDCNWTSTGVYSVPLYMQDAATASYYGVFDTLTITVVDGTAGVDCNVPADFITQPSDQTSTATTVATPTGIADLFVVFSGGSATMKFFFGIIIILGMASMAFAAYKSFAMAIVFAVGGLVLVTILGLIPLWVIVGMALLTALPLLLKMVFGKSG